MKTKGRFIAILALLSLLVSMMSAIPAAGAVAGTIALTGGAVTDSVRWYSTVGGSNVATVSVTDADKNVARTLANGYEIVRDASGPEQDFTVSNTPMSSTGVSVEALQDGTLYPFSSLTPSTGAIATSADTKQEDVLTVSPDLLLTATTTIGSHAASFFSIPLRATPTRDPITPTRLRFDVADLEAGTPDNVATTGVQIRVTGKLKNIYGQAIDGAGVVETTEASEFKTYTVGTVADEATVTFLPGATGDIWGAISLIEVLDASTGGNGYTVRVRETFTIAVRYTYDDEDTITGRATLTSSAHTTTIALTLNETLPSSSIFTATATLTSTIGSHTSGPTSTATVYVTDGALLTFSYNDQDPVATVTATARADLKAPTITLIGPVHESSTNVGALSFVVTVTDEVSADSKASGLNTTDVDNIVVNGSASADLTPLLIGTNSFQTSYSQTISSQGLTKWWFPVKDKVGNVPVFSGTTPAPILGAGNPASPTTEPAKPFKVTIDTAAPTVDTSTVQTGGKLTTATTTPFATTWGADTAQRKNVTVNFSLGTGTAKLDPATLSASAWSVGGVTPSSAAIDTDGDTVVLTMAADLATDATPKVELATAGLKDKAGNTMATLTGTAAPTALDRLKPVVDVSLSPTTITKTKVTITVTSGETLNSPPTVTLHPTSDVTANPTTLTVTATGTKSWTAEHTAADASKRWVKVVGTDLTGSNVETRGEGTPSTDVITFEVDTAAPSKAAPSATGTATAGPVWIVVRYDEDEYTGDTHKSLAVVSATLATGTATAVSVASEVFISSTTVDEAGNALNETHATVTLAKNLAVGTYTYVIVVKDDADNSSTSFTHTLTVSAKPAFEITLNPGVNLISIPGDLVGDGGNINVALTGLPVTAVLTYDAARNKAGQNPWLSSTKDAATGLFTGDIAVLAPGKAYFVTASARAILKLNLVSVGTALPPVIPVLQGFNAVGFWSIQGNLTTTTNNTADADAYLGSVKWSVAYSFDPTPGVGWQVIRPDLDPTTGTTLKAGRGYLVYVTQDGTLTP